MAAANEVLDSSVSTIIKEEFIVPDDPVLHVDQEILLDTSCEQIKTTEPVGKREKDFVKKIKNRIQVLNKRKSSDDVEIIFEKTTMPAVNPCALNNSIAVGQGVVPLHTVTTKKTISEKFNKSETKNLTSSSILTSQASVKNSNVHQNLENSSRRVSTAISILKIPNLMNKGTTIAMSDLPKNINPKSFSKAKSVLKSAIKPVSRKVTKVSESENLKKIVDLEKDKPTLHVLNMKEKQIVIRDNNFTEIKKEVVEANLDEQVANRKRRRYYHGICFTCRKLQAPNDERDKCQVCLTKFQYECLRCRDILSSKEEYYNHLKNALYCSEIHVPPYLWNDSYALATRAELHQCSDVVWDRTQKLISLVKEARAKLKGKFNRIKSCCLMCDTRQDVERGSFLCKQCNVKSVFNCQTCDRSYYTYCGAIYHTESCMVKKPIFECNDCSFKHKKKRELIIHMRSKHLPMKPRLKKKANIVFQCPDCHLIIRKVSYWRKHFYICREKVYFRCTLCSEKYLTKKEIMVHLLVAHQMTDFVVAEMIKGIERDRNNEEERKKQRKLNLERKKQRKQDILESKKKCKVFRSRYVNPYCLKCDSIVDINMSTNEDQYCRTCRASVKMQCKFCKRFFHKYRHAYAHIDRCEKIRKASVNKKTDIPNRNVINVKTYRIVNKNTQQLNLVNDKELENSSTLEDTEIQLNDKLANANDQFCHFILGDEALSNENELEIDSTLEENEMQLDGNNHVEPEDQDIKVFDGLINFDNYEVIIPDKIER